MKRPLGQIIGDTLQLSLGYSEMLLKDVNADQFARLAIPGGQTIASNHPAFIFGHLSLYGVRIAELAGAEALPLPDGFTDLFSNKAPCVDDPDGNVYPPMEDIMGFFLSSYGSAREAILVADDEKLDQPNPAPGRMADRFPTTGSMANFLAGGHMMLHLGQLSAWRRMQGLGPA